jgi:putative endonuclease
MALSQKRAPLHSIRVVDARGARADPPGVKPSGRERPAADPRRVFGRYGEEAAAAHLRRKGLRILARNVRTAFGEIDLVALDGVVVVFVEVKARRSASGLEAVDIRKQRRLARLALAFLSRAGWTDRAARFDVVAVASDGACTHVVNAFDCGP